MSLCLCKVNLSKRYHYNFLFNEPVFVRDFVCLNRDFKSSFNNFFSTQNWGNCLHISNAGADVQVLVKINLLQYLSRSDYRHTHLGCV